MRWFPMPQCLDSRRAEHAPRGGPATSRIPLRSQLRQRRQAIAHLIMPRAREPCETPFSKHRKEKVLQNVCNWFWMV